MAQLANSGTIYAQYLQALSALALVPVALERATETAESARKTALVAANAAAVHETTRLNAVRAKAEADYRALTATLRNAGVSTAPQVRAQPTTLELAATLSASVDAAARVNRELNARSRARESARAEQDRQTLAANSAADAYSKWQSNARRERAESDRVAHDLAEKQSALASARRRRLIIGGAAIALTLVVVVVVFLFA